MYTLTSIQFLPEVSRHLSAKSVSNIKKYHLVTEQEKKIQRNMLQAMLNISLHEKIDKDMTYLYKH
jgi:hypothetical protein